MEDTHATTKEASREAVHATKNAQVAVEAARMAQVEEIGERTTEALTKALRDVFGEGVASGRFIDVTRIPLICQSIISLHGDISEIKDNIKWAVRIVLGAVILAIVYTVIKH